MHTTNKGLDINWAVQWQNGGIIRAFHSMQLTAPYYLHPAYHYAFELSYKDHLIAAFTRMKSFREGVGSFAKLSAVAGRDRIDGDEELSRRGWEFCEAIRCCWSGPH
ncbi:hypothetical protein Taro_033234 [Colocasia esculenta]|uniref:Uncharacterized protein n=1 Tax=Colocasia esculenta TaxID=4460 RepID=A0A843W468_COLES|nr:hypothetical protein [Colocasia esculenta]